MSITNHSLDLMDHVEMTAARAYLASQPRMGVTPAARGAFATFMSMVPPAEGVTFAEATIGSVAGWWCKPQTAAANSAIVHFHGGAYVIGSAEAYRHLGSQIAAAAGAAVFLPEYALAPERPFPAAFIDARSVVEGMGTEGYERLALSGDSAGGRLALAVTIELARSASLSSLGIRAVAAVSPWTDLTLAAASVATRAEADPLLSQEALHQAADLYAVGAVDRRDPRLSPRYGALSGLPPVMIHVGGDEVLLDDTVGLAAEGAAQGVEVEAHVWEGMTHVFPASVATLRAARNAMGMMGGFLRSNLEGKTA